MKRAAVICLAIVLMLIPIMGLNCDSDGDNGNENENEHENEEVLTGQLPILQTGDEWTSMIISNGIEYTLTIEVTGEDVINGIDCFIVEASFDPSYGGTVDSTTLNYNKETMLSIRAQTSGESMDMPYIVTGSYSYEFPGAPRYPREAGKEYEVIETLTTSTTITGETTTETEVNTYIYRVEKIEEITVPAGTFKCFKEVKYDETGMTALETTWYSEKAKYSVKKIDHEYGDTTELMSYSVK